MCRSRRPARLADEKLARLAGALEKGGDSDAGKVYAVWGALGGSSSEHLPRRARCGGACGFCSLGSFPHAGMRGVLPVAVTPYHPPLWSNTVAWAPEGPCAQDSPAGRIARARGMHGRQSRTVDGRAHCCHAAPADPLRRHLQLSPKHLTHCSSGQQPLPGSRLCGGAAAPWLPECACCPPSGGAAADPPVSTLSCPPAFLPSGESKLAGSCSA